MAATCRRVLHGVPPLLLSAQTSNSPARKRRASSVFGFAKNVGAGAALDDAAAMHQHDVAGEPARLAEIVRRHHHLDARARRPCAPRPRSPGWRPDRGSRSARRGTAPPGRARARAPAPAAAARRRTAAAPGDPPSPDSPTSAEQFLDARRPLRARDPGAGERIADVGRGAAPEHGRALEHDGAARRRRVGAAAPGDGPAGRARSGPSSGAAAWSCRRRSARSARSARRAKSSAKRRRGWRCRARG